MGEHEEKIEIMRKYLTDMSTGFYCHIGGEVPSKKINNALKTFAQGMDSEDRKSTRLNSSHPSSSRMPSSA